MHVVVVESPAKSKTLQSYLGKDYQVLASFGHIRDLPSKDGSVEPEQDFAMHYEVSDGSKKHIQAIANATKKATSLVLASDPDREGEAIAWHVLEALAAKKALPKDLQVKRVVFHSITKKAVLEAMANPRELDMDLVNAQQARRALDYLVGFSLSPLLWRKLPGSRSAGRVQSVALRLVCEREEEIEAFTAREYWSITARLQTAKGAFSARLTHLEGKKLDKYALANEAQALEAAATVGGQPYRITSLKPKQTKRNPQPPFTTSTLQQEAARKLGWTAKHTMQVAQKLYEGVPLGGEATGLITYMRTDSVALAGEALTEARQVIEKEYGAEYVPEKPRFYASKAKNAQEAHEAIRPTGIMRQPDHLRRALNEEQYKLYRLIWQRTVASQMNPQILDQLAVELTAADQKAQLQAHGSTVKFDGFYRLYHEDKDDEEEEGEHRLPALTEGEEATLLPAEKDQANPEAKQHFTQPPPRYSEASLVKKLEELGIGRPSTYASILSVLQERDYVELEKKRFIPHTRGRLVTAFLVNFFPRYVEYDFTAHLEDELDEIARGELFWKEALKVFWEPFSAKIAEVKEHELKQVISSLNQSLDHFLFPGEGTLEERRTCPACHEGRLSLKLGKFGAFIGCSRYPECKHTVKLEGRASEGGAEEASAEDTGPRLLGQDPETGEEVTVRKGPYGWYVQRGEGTKKAKPPRVSLPKGVPLETIELIQALALLALPREVGPHPETGDKIEAGIGRYGPYLRYQGRYINLKGEEAEGLGVTEIGLNRAVTLIAEAPAPKRGKVEPLKVLGKHPETGKEIALFEGRYGPYVKHEKTNASLPKNADMEAFTLEEAAALLDAKAASGTKKKPAKKRKKAS